MGTEVYRVLTLVFTPHSFFLYKDIKAIRQELLCTKTIKYSIASVQQALIHDLVREDIKREGQKDHKNGKECKA